MFKKKFISKKVLIVKVAHNGPLDSSSQKNGPGGQHYQGCGVVLHVQEEVYQSTLTFRRRVARNKNDALDPSRQNFDLLLLVLHIQVLS